MKEKNYFKWLFTRWYLYVLSILFFMINSLSQGWSYNNFFELLGGLIAYFFFVGSSILIIKKLKNYWKWLFTRWYLYVLAFLFFLIGLIYTPYPINFYLIIAFIGNLIFAIIIISVIYSIIKLIKKIRKKK